MKKYLIILLGSLLFTRVAPAQTLRERLESLQQNLEQNLIEPGRTWLEISEQQFRNSWQDISFEPAEQAEPGAKPFAPTIGKLSQEVAPSVAIQSQLLLPREEERLASSKSLIQREELPRLNARYSKSLSAQVNCVYYGRALNLRHNPRLAYNVPRSWNETSIKNFWAHLEKAEGEASIYQLITQADKLQLNDWGFALLCNAYAKRLYPGKYNAQTVFNHYALSKSGVKARLSYQRGRLYLLLPTRQTIYGATFLRDQRLKYYALDLNGRKVSLDRAKVLMREYPRAHKVLDLEVREPMSFPYKRVSRSLSFTYQGKSYRFRADANKNVVDFYRNYPFTDWQVQFRTPLSSSTRYSVLSQVKPWLKGKSTPEAINLLLRFVQTAFPYQSDTQQFGGENYLFAEETLYYPYSDCEDRSALFAYLVKECLGLEVIGLIFPGHAAVGVHFPRPVEGAYISHRGKRFVICDPTYINASYGMYLPQVKGKKARIFSL